jgi:hypothetical protein
MVNRADMRASDGDRDRVSELLRDAHGEGRLGQDELLQRIDSTYNAKTFRDLDRLIEDLPIARRPARALARPISAPAPAKGGGVRRAARVLLNLNWWIYGVVVALCTTIWFITAVAGGGLQDLWPLWVAGPWGVLLLAAESGYRMVAPRPDRR